MRPAEDLEKIRPVVERVVNGHGLEVFDLQLRREPIGWVLRVVIDRPALKDDRGNVTVEDLARAIGIEDCQQVSHDLSAVLDVEETLDAQYTLEVSSPGTDRPLRGADDYRRFAGRVAKIVVREAVDGQMHFEGRLAGLDGPDVVLEVGRQGKTKRIPFDRIARAKLDVEF